MINFQMQRETYLHKSMVEVKSENMLRYNVKKLQIIECTGEFELNDAFNSSAFNGVCF